MRVWRHLLAAVLAMAGLTLVSGAGAAELKEGRDFERISPPLAADRTKIEVTEFFWYGCPHCFDFEPVLGAWLKKLPADATFRRVPAIFPNPKWPFAARLFYTLEAMNLVPRLHDDVFNAIHLDRRRLFEEKVVFEWVAKKGVDMKKFGEAWVSPGVRSQVEQARELTLGAGVLGVPALMVDGRYMALSAANQGDMLATVNQLIARVRAERAAAGREQRGLPSGE